jgi:hypothetical protein
VDKENIIYRDVKYSEFEPFVQLFFLKRQSLERKGFYKLRTVPIDKLACLSIAKWIVLARFVRREQQYIYDGGLATCALCRFYSSTCAKCPIAIYVGEPHCRNTPYRNYFEMRYWRGVKKKQTIHSAYFYASQEVHFLLRVRDSTKETK